jgi:hypothetical protein
MPDLVPPLDGVNLITVLHREATDPVQLLEKIEKSLDPVSTTLVKLTDPPVVVPVTLSDELDSTVIFPNARLDGLIAKVAAGATPVPVIETVCGLPVAVSV